MEYEIISVNHYWGNNFSGSRLAKLYSDKTIVYEPEPDYPDFEEESQEEEVEDE